MIEKRRNFVFRFLPGLFLSGLLLLSGCSQDDVSGIPVGSRAIGFRAQGGMSSLKATTATAGSIRSFAVNAHYGKDAWDTSKFLLQGITVYRGEGGGSSWTYSPQAYFPTTDEGDVEFFAYSPSGSENVQAGGLKAATDDSQTITYEVPEPTGAATSQEDLLVARHTVVYNDEKGAYPGTEVSLQFHHALSRILVAASSSLGQEVPVVITRLELKNLYSKGDLSLSSPEIPVTEGWGYTNGEAGNKVLWANDGTTLASYAYSLPASGVHVGEALATVTGDDQGIFILPQQTKGADVTDTDRDGEFGLEIAYTVNGNPAPAPAFIQFPDLVNSTKASVTFEIGRQYVLNLTFGAGSGTGGGETPGGSDPDINIGAKISFGTLGVDGNPDDIDVYPPQPPTPPYAHDPVIWSQSNIYYDESAVGSDSDNVGAMTFSEETAYKYQGVYFRWGSLVGVSVGANYSSFSVNDYLFIPDVNGDGKYYKVQISALAGTHSETSVEDFKDFVDTYANPEVSWDDLDNGDSSAATALGALWTALPYATSTDVTPVPADNATGRTDRDDNALTEVSASLYSSYKGDVCKYLVDNRSTNGNSASITDGYAWRLPTSSEFSIKPGGTNTNDDDTQDFTIGDYTTRWKSDGSNGGTVTAGSTPENGMALMSEGGYSFYTLTWVSDGTAEPDFPASGVRYYDSGSQDYFGNGLYWSSSAYGASSACNLYFNYGTVNPYSCIDRLFGQSVRCVRL
ncbi:MAG: fimbrillin family protein [Prevotella sp.]|jgi:hypothetical protein|nr:fimbrillin family protein [Prevotella sp.]